MNNLQSLSHVRDILDVFDQRYYNLKEALLAHKGDTSYLEKKYRYAATEVILALNESITERTIDEDEQKKEEYIKKLLEIICDCANVDQKELLLSANSRDEKFLIPRQLHMSLLHKTFKLSLTKAAGAYGQDHSTCSYSYKAARRAYQSDKFFRDQYWPVIDHCIKYDTAVKKNRTMDYLNGKS